MTAGSSTSGPDGERGTADEMEFDLSEAYNRIADTWYTVFAPTGPLSMSIAACAYPINMGEHMIAAIRDDVLPEDYHLRWQMAIDPAGTSAGGEFHLYCNWQGREWQHDDDRYMFIENAVGWVDWLGQDGSERLDVKVAFGRPLFVDHIATMVVDFFVSEIDAAGALRREADRPFRIYADGRREPLF